MKKKTSQGSNAAVAVPQKKKTSVFKILKNNRTLMLMCLPAIIFFIDLIDGNLLTSPHKCLRRHEKTA